jgi:NOL1/NOP2/sun family putative RNA methylase
MLPIKFQERMKQMLGSEYPAFMESYDAFLQPSLRLNPGKAGKDAFFENSGFHLSPVPWEEQGFYYAAGDAPGKHPYHEAGVYYIQEASAMAPAVYLEAKPGERILDLCAAPGGKSTGIAAAMQGKGLLVCNEIQPSRAKILSENMERMGVTNALVVNETPQHLAKQFPEFFHRIMVDAPCSGEGMFRKTKEAIQEWSPENVAMCGRRQDEILEEAYRMLMPGGRLVYSTCTFAPEENEGTVSRFLYAHPDMHIRKVPMYDGMTGGRADWYEDFATHTSAYSSCLDIPVAEGIERTLRLFPHKLAGEGHFVAVLQKDGAGETDGKYPVEKTLTYDKLPELAAFARDCLLPEEEAILAQQRFLKFGDQVYLVGYDLPRLKGMKVLRPGLHLGTIKKDRLEPAHAWALSLAPEKVYRVLELRKDEKAVAAYINGETLSIAAGTPVNRKQTPAKGWCLITVDGYSLGWGKLTGEVMKNHYPKGLRKRIAWGEVL